MDIEVFEERAAIMEFDGGLSRFSAETKAAQAQGRQRKEFLDAIDQRNSERARDRRAAAERQRDHDMPAVQRASEEKARSLSQRDVQA